jgi:diguanylate cyclase
LITALVSLPLLLFAPQGAAGDPSFLLDSETNHLVINNHLSYLVEEQPLTHLQISAPERQNQWQPLSGASFNFGTLHPPVWVRFDIANNSLTDHLWLLEIGWPLLEQVQVFQFNHTTQRWASAMTSGNNISMDQRPVLHHHFLFPISLLFNERATVYIRVESRMALFLTIDLWRNRTFWLQDQQRILSLGIFFGILLIMVLYNLALYAFTKDINYLFYVMYAVAVLMYELAGTGIGGRYLWDNTLWFRQMAYVFFACLSFLAATIFTRVFLSLKSYGGWLLQLNNVILAYWLVATLSCAWGDNFLLDYTSQPAAMLSPLAAILTGVYLWIKGNVQAKYYTIAYSFLDVGTIVLMLGLSGIVPRGPLTEYGQMVGFVLQFVLLSLSLADRINRERRQREEAQRVALDLSRKMGKAHEEKLMIQEQVLEVQRRANEELDIRVLDRTHELERAMKNLELANRELSKLSFTDPLTRIHNRRYFDQIINSEIRRAARTQQPLSVAIADIDHFKQINELHGYLIGDECLRLVAKTLSQQLGRTGDFMARYGGEEFAVILPTTTQDNAMVAVDRARAAVENINFINAGKRIPISVSIGVAGWVPKPDEAPHRLLHAADSALQQAKNHGRNKAVAAR